MNKFRININKTPVLDNEIVQALVRNQIAFDDGKTPEERDLKLGHQACWDFMTGVDDVFKSTAQKTGRPADQGITKSIIVSALIELKRRKLAALGDPKALLNAKKIAIQDFELSNLDDSAIRTINRYWSEGSPTVFALQCKELELLIAPYCKDKKVA